MCEVELVRITCLVDFARLFCLLGCACDCLLVCGLADSGIQAGQQGGQHSILRDRRRLSLGPVTV
jgi:hypothetical protein